MTDTNIPKPPAKVAPPNYAAIVAMFGEAIWGSKWALDMGRFTGINPRTLSRIYAAHKQGRDYPAAPGVLAALYRNLGPVLADLKPWADHVGLDGR